jgi:hypothetical protein
MDFHCNKSLMNFHIFTNYTKISADVLLFGFGGSLCTYGFYAACMSIIASVFDIWILIIRDLTIVSEKKICDNAEFSVYF